MAYEALAGALLKERKFDKMSELIDEALRRNIRPSNDLCLKYTSALHKAGNTYWLKMVLLKMQESGYTPCRKLLIAVICCLCEMRNLDQVLELLDMMHLSLNRQNSANFQLLH